MRVAYFTESLYPHVDGVSRTLARLFGTLERRGIDFRVFSPFTPGNDIPWAPRVRRVGYLHFPPYPDYRVTLPFTRGIASQLDDFRPDLVHVVSPTPMGYRAQRLARARGLPVVASFHTHFVSYFRYYGVKWLEPAGWALLRTFYRNCSRVYVPSVSIGRELETRGIHQVELWSRGIDLDGFSPEFADPSIRRRITAGEDVPVLLLVSRLVKEKDLADLVDVERILRERGLRFGLALVGDGPMRPALEAALPAATFAGHLEGEELSRWYASADVFLFPSTTETLGNVVLEAQASGLPAVVADRGGPQDLITHGTNGYVATANDTAGIAGFVERLIEQPRLRERMGDAARRSASSRDWEEINGGLVASYEDVISGASGQTAAVGDG
ncbi:MAG: glycosyltransferase family 1 protein [Gemmatimonadota bacterium]